MQKRIAKIQNLLENNEAVLIESGANRLYFTGFNSSAGCVVITKDSSVFFIDFRYFEKAKQVVSSCEVRLSNRNVEEIKDLVSKSGVKRLFVEGYSMSVDRFNGLIRAFDGIELIADERIDKAIENMRSVKTADELSLIKQAQEMTDKTFSYILNNISVGRSERDIMLDMEFYMRKLGSEGVSFDFIVVSGKNSSLPHGVPTDKAVESGDFITMDFGAVVKGYRSDMTRTVAVGNVSDEQARIYDTVLKAQLAAIDKIKAGVICKDIDKVARDLIYGAGYEGCFGHGLGHSVGIEIHENPNFNTRCETVLKSGTIMTVEPGIYIENKYGVRIEDMVYVTDNGCENLTKSDKSLIIL